jgi:YHS domain-containing protein
MYPITFSEIEAEVRAGTEEAQTISLKAKPQTGETEGSSRFVGTLPAALKKKPVSLTLTLPLADNIHVVRFSAEELAPKTETASAAHPEMPTPLATSGDITPEEKALFLTPGGRYTAADIGANGNRVPRQKFQGEMAKHDRNPKKGDRICPITDTLANPKFAWIIGGKTYLFCCPPCVEEFLKTAKEKPETVQEPTAYVQK